MSDYLLDVDVWPAQDGVPARDDLIIPRIEECCAEAERNTGQRPTRLLLTPHSLAALVRHPDVFHLLAEGDGLTVLGGLRIEVT